MRYRAIYFDGCNGMKLGEIVDQAEAFQRAARSRNGDGLLEDAEGQVYWVPLDDGFEANPVCLGESEDDEDEDD